MVLFKINTGFESVVSRVKRVDRDSYASYTEKYQEHIPCSFSYKVGFIDDKFSKFIVFYGGKMQPIGSLQQFFMSIIGILVRQ